MTSFVKRGLIAGAVGTTVLNTVTYLDMAVRGRSASRVPGQTVEAALAAIGQQVPGSSEQNSSRLTALGAVSGAMAGLAVGVAGSAVRAAGLRVPAPVASVALGGAAMAATDVPAAILGVVDPASWTAQDWVSDAVPHLAYGAAAAATLRAFPDPDRPVRRASLGLLLRSASLGIASGSRSSLGFAAPALTSSSSGRVTKGLALLAVTGELIGDKRADAPARTAAQPLAARFAAAVGGSSALARRDQANAALPAAVAAAGATASSFGGLAWRRWSRGRMPDWQAALMEDALACVLAVLACRRR